jgi:hypothetical protein
MLWWLWKTCGFGRNGSTHEAKYDPVYGLPRRSVEEWLARNPQLREEYEVQEWLARNPPLRREYEETWRQGLVTRGGRPRRTAGGAGSATPEPSRGSVETMLHDRH